MDIPPQGDLPSLLGSSDTRFEMEIPCLPSLLSHSLPLCAEMEIPPQADLPPLPPSLLAAPTLLNSGSLLEAMSSLGEGQQHLSNTLEWMMDRLQNHLAHDIAEMLLSNGAAHICGPSTRIKKPTARPCSREAGDRPPLAGSLSSGGPSILRESTALSVVSSRAPGLHGRLHALAAMNRSSLLDLPGELDEPAETGEIVGKNNLRSPGGESQSQPGSEELKDWRNELKEVAAEPQPKISIGRPQSQVSAGTPERQSQSTGLGSCGLGSRNSRRKFSGRRNFSVSSGLSSRPRSSCHMKTIHSANMAPVASPRRRQISPGYSIKPNYTPRQSDSVEQPTGILRAANKVLGSNDKEQPRKEEQQPCTMKREVSVSTAETLRQSLLLRLAPQNTVSKLCQQAALSCWFQAGCAVMILVNCMLLGYSAEYAVDHDTEAVWVYIANHICVLYFLLELMIRMTAFGRSFFTSDEKGWNIFDFVLVFQSIVDFVLEFCTFGEGFGEMSALKTLKLLRIMRVIRVFKIFKELSLMMLMVANSMKSLSWVLLLLFLMMYTFAIFFTQICTDNIKAHPDSAHAIHAQEQFGTMARTIYSLILSILGGVSWGQICNTLISIGVVPTSVFLCYISFSTLAVLNIITGVFVENAVEIAKNRKDVMIEKADQRRMAIVNELRGLFDDMDEDESGSISYDEMSEAWTNPDVRACFTSLGLDLHDMERLYLLIDEENTGDVDIDDFLGGCIKLRGEARSIDVHAILRETKKLHWRLEDQELRLEEAIVTLGKVHVADNMENHTKIIVGHMNFTSKRTEGTVAKWGKSIDNAQRLIELNGPRDGYDISTHSEQEKDLGPVFASAEREEGGAACPPPSPSWSRGAMMGRVVSSAVGLDERIGSDLQNLQSSVSPGNISM